MFDSHRSPIGLPALSWEGVRADDCLLPDRNAGKPTIKGDGLIDKELTMSHSFCARI